VNREGRTKKIRQKQKNPTNIALFLLFFCKVIAHVLFNATHPPTQHFQSKVKAGKYQKKTPSGISETEIRLFEEKNQNKSSNK
jgi:hypothetical protein